MWTTEGRVVNSSALSFKTYFSYASAACGLVVLFIAILACGGDGTGAPCASPAVGTHAVPANGFGCHIECAPGYFDCDGDNVDGCESTLPCTTPQPGEGGLPPPPIHLLTTLSGMPHGIATCAGNVYFFDDGSLMTVSGKKLFTFAATPSGGIACDGTDLFFATLSSGDAGPSGVVYRFHPGDSAPTPVVNGVDPGRGIDTRAGSIYWIARSGVGDAGPMLEATNDAGTTAILGAVETTTYKSFALMDDGDYALSGGSVWASPLDGGPASTLGFDATNARALLRANGALPLAIVTLDAGDGIMTMEDASTQIALTPRIVATASDAAHAVFATDDAVYEWSYNGGVKLLSSPYLHITDITLDGTFAYWVTRGAAATPGAVWRANL
jgi:hypothetical protein